MLWLMIACSTGEKDSGVDTSTAICEDTVSITCEDAMISDLSLHDDKISDGEVSTTGGDENFVSVVDASAGGFNSSSNNPWVYVKFTETGLEKVEIDDETALDSMDWDLSLKRFILRLNGGSSGGSCVGAVSLLESTYDELDEIPEGLNFIKDDFYTEDCTLINDSSGLQGSPQVALSPWWSYSGCVQTTMVPHLIQLANGQVVKMVVEAYYETNQDVCNEQGAMGSGSAIYTLRWTFME